MSYWDSSALIKLYVQEFDSAVFRGLAANATRVVTASLSRFGHRHWQRPVKKSPSEATPFNEQLRTSLITSLAGHLQPSCNCTRTRIVKRRLLPEARMSPSPKYHRRLACALPYPGSFVTAEQKIKA
jgi:hypothetical protein